MPDENPPKITLALADPELRKRVLELLDQAKVEVRTVRPDDDLWDKIEGEDADVVLVRRRHLPAGEKGEDSLGGDESPGVIVLSDEEEPADRADLLAAGVAGVVPTSTSDRVLADAVEKLAAAEADGGLDGPAVRGQETEPRLSDFLSRSPNMRRFVALVERVADSDTSIMITGETGVGKERLARAIHAESSRCSGPFVSVNCGALPEQLLESELFGHVAGAFTGADRARRGRFELASGGTILLDEIGEMPTHLQVRLLTVLQRHEVIPVGSEKIVPVDVRVLAATNRDPGEEVAAGRLREDLYYRLKVVSLTIPPLRERKEDLPDLVGRFIRHFRDASDCPVDGILPDALEALLRHDWPGNVRELINVIERAALVAREPRITLEDLPEEIRSTTSSSGSPAELDAGWLDLPLKEVRKRAMARLERAYLEALLDRHQGSVSATAEAAGISTRALYDKMKRHQLAKEDFYDAG